MFKKLIFSVLILIMALSSLLLPSISTVQAYNSYEDFGGYKAINLYSIDGLKTGTYEVYGTGELRHPLLDFMEEKQSLIGFPVSEIDTFTIRYKKAGVTVAYIEFRHAYLYAYNIDNPSETIEWRFRDVNVDLRAVRYFYEGAIFPTDLNGCSTYLAYMQIAGCSFSEEIPFSFYDENDYYDENPMESKQELFNKVHALMQQAFQITLGYTTEGPAFVVSGSLLELPTPTKTGYTFDGWYTDPALTTPFTTTVMPAEDFTIYAKWDINSYSLTFNSNGGSTVSTMQLNYGATIGTLPTPTKTGYTFAGWCTDAELTTLFTQSTMPGEELTLHAKWTAESTDPVDPEDPTDPNDPEDPAQEEGLIDILLRKLINPFNEKVLKPFYDAVIAPLALLFGVDAWIIWTGLAVVVLIIIPGILSFIRKKLGGKQ